MFKYAQIDETTGFCFAVSYLSGEVDLPNMLPLKDDDDVRPGDIYTDGEWTRPEPPPPVEPSPTPEQIQISALNDIAAQLLLDSATKDAEISQQSDMIAGLMMTVAQLQGGSV